MKKLLALFILTSCVTMLHAQPYGRCTSGSCGQSGAYQGQPYNQGQGYGNSGQQYGNGNPAMAPLQYGSQANNGQHGSPLHSDSRLAEQIQDSLRKDSSNKYSNVTVNANNGYVTLRGEVASQNDKTAAEQKVRGMQGVQNVNNQLTVKNS